MRRRSIVPAGLALAVLALSTPSALASGTLSVNKRAMSAAGTPVAVGDEAGTVTGTFEDKTGSGEQETRTAIDCGSNCSEPIFDDEGACPPDDSCPVHEEVNLTTTTQTGWSFAGWTGCAGTSPCTVTMSANRSVTASYQDAQDPTVSLVAPPVGPRRETSLSAGATGTDNWRVEKVEFLLDDVVNGTDTNPADGFTHSFNIAGKGEGASFTIGVRSVDPSGRQSTIASRTYTVDRVAPVAALTSGPPANAIIGVSEATFGFSATDASPVTWECRLDGAAFGACTGNASHHMTGLADGPHTVSVRAIDAAGNIGEASRGFTVNAVRPAVTITDGPGEGAIITATQATIRFAATGGAAECALDSGTFRACSGPGTDSLSGLADGPHTFRVRVRDEVGDEAVAFRTFRVDTTVVEPPPPPKPILNPTLFSRSDAFRRYTIFKRLVLKGVPAGSQVTVKCTGKKCPAKRFSRTGRGSIKLGKFIKKRLRVGTTLTIRVTRAGAIGKQFVLKIRKRKPPRITISQIS